MAQATTWKGSMQRMASGQHSATTSAIHSAASAETRRIAAQRWAPRSLKKARTVARVRSGFAHTRAPVSWSTTTIRYL